MILVKTISVVGLVVLCLSTVTLMSYIRYENGFYKGVICEMRALDVDYRSCNITCSYGGLEKWIVKDCNYVTYSIWKETAEVREVKYKAIPLVAIFGMSSGIVTSLFPVFYNGYVA